MYLQLSNLHKSFDGREVVKGISLSLEKSNILCLLGASGCGKTTTLRMISGLLNADQGQVIIDGEDITGLPPEKRPVSTVFQSYALFPNMNVLENVIYGLKLRKIPLKAAKAQGMEYLEIAGLTQYANSRVYEISGGEQQRVALMRALILKPKVLLLDEPLSNLDAKLRIKMRIELKELRDKFNITMVFVTHDREEAMVISDKIAVMNEGRIVQIGAPGELYNKPHDGFVMEFFGDVNNFKLGEKNIKLRPEDLYFSPEGKYTGKILRHDFYGFYRIYRVDSALGRLAILSPKEEIYNIGDTVRFSIKEGELQ